MALQSSRSEESRSRRRLAAAKAVLVTAALIMSVVFVAGLGHHVRASTLCCADDAFNAVAAKNLATGRGYASSYYPTPTGDTGVTRFDPRISTGPVLILPTAAAIAVLGNRYWVPGAAALGVDLGLLVAFFALLARGGTGWVPAVLIALPALVLATLGHLWQWYALLGEVAAFLLLTLAVLLALDGGRRWWDRALGGLLAGLACLAKALSLLALPVLLGFVFLDAARAGVTAAGPSGRKRLGRGVRCAAVTLACFCIPVGLFEAAKLLDLGAAGYREVRTTEANLFRSAPGAGARHLLGSERAAYVRATSARNWLALEEYFGAGWQIGAYLAALVLGLAARRRWTGCEGLAPLALTSIAALYTAWWLPVAGAARLRYLLIGLGIWCLAVVLDLWRGPWSVRKSALACCFALALLPRAAQAGTLLPHRPLFGPSSRTLAMLATARFLETWRHDRLVAADWWATGEDIEYLLDGTGNLVSHLTLERRGNPPVLFLENAQWVDLPPGVRERWDAALERFHAELVFERPPYRIYAAPPLAGSRREGR